MPKIEQGTKVSGQILKKKTIFVFVADNPFKGREREGYAALNFCLNNKSFWFEVLKKISKAKFSLPFGPIKIIFIYKISIQIQGKKELK